MTNKENKENQKNTFINPLLETCVEAFVGLCAVQQSIMGVLVFGSNSLWAARAPECFPVQILSESIEHIGLHIGLQQRVK